MLIVTNRIQTRESTFRSILVNYVLVLTISLTVAWGLLSGLWFRNINLCHTVSELICIFIALSSFFVIWLNYKHNLPVNQILGFGFLIVACFDTFHTYFFQGLNLYPKGCTDITTKFWILGRLTEGAVLLLSVLKPSRLKINKWIGLLFSALFAGVMAYLVLTYEYLLPKLFIPDKGMTPVKVVLEYSVIALFAITLFVLRKDVNGRNAVTLRYIFLGLLIAIPGEICFTMFNTVNSFTNSMGHLLKIFYYYFLFKGIFISSVTYPYEKLEAAGDYLADILNHLPIGLTTYDSNKKVSFINQRGLEITGYTREEMYGLTSDQMFSKLYSGSQKSVIEKNESQSVDSEIKAIKTMEGKHIKLSVDTIELKNGGFLYLYDEVKKAQELETLQLQTRTILDSISNLIVITDKNNKIVMCNRAFENVIELDAQDILGADIHELIVKLQFRRKGLCKHSNNMCKSRKSFECSIITLKGNTKELLVHSAPILNIEGEAIGNIGVFSDITSLKEEQQKLQQQEKLALLGQMSASIVHETKNFLATIKGYCQVTLLKISDEQVKNYVRKIDSLTNDVNRVVTDFLALSKPRAPVLHEFSLNELMLSMKFMLESTSLIKGIDLNIILGNEEKPVMCDEGQIKQVVLNIAKNAMEAMSECESPVLTITTGVYASKSEMFIKISDNGKGMSEQEKLKIGTPFFSTKELGTGLGLSTCYQMIHEHGGKINVESELGKGTSFTILLPCLTGQQKSDIPA